jgi:hypothetical protein
VKTELKLQYQLGNGNWWDCSNNPVDRTEEFLKLCMKYDPRTNNNLETTIELLLSGETLRNHDQDWYSKCRNKPADKVSTKDFPNGKKLNCGHTIYYKAHEMGASLGSSCSDCYDKMSD